MDPGNLSTFNLVIEYYLAKTTISITVNKSSSGVQPEQSSSRNSNPEISVILYLLAPLFDYNIFFFY
jgi:hypothetical protein